MVGGLKMKGYYNLDFLRAFAMMMGLFMHASILFTMPDLAKEFQIENITPAEVWVYLLNNFIGNWRMPLFFLLSGFFAILVIEKKRVLLLHKGSDYKNRHNLFIIFSFLRYVRWKV